MDLLKTDLGLSHHLADKMEHAVLPSSLVAIELRFTRCMNPLPDFGRGSFSTPLVPQAYSCSIRNFSSVCSIWMLRNYFS